MSKPAQGKVRISMTKSGPNGEVTIAGLSEQEVEQLEGMLLGQWWMQGSNGHLTFSPGRDPAPSPAQDEMLPQWRLPVTSGEASMGDAHYQMEIFQSEGQWINQTPSIIIQHLCGYNYTPEGYRENAETLSKFGFKCLRSPRDDSGRYYESWLLPGLWSARGTLLAEINKHPKEKKFAAAIEFLRWTTSFGTLDVAVQRMCQVLD